MNSYILPYALFLYFTYTGLWIFPAPTNHQENIGFESIFQRNLTFNTDTTGLPSHYYHTFRSGLHNSYLKFTHQKKGRVAFLGGSITHNPGWRDSVRKHLEHRFPETDFDFIAAGIPSMGSTPGAFRLQRDVLKNGPVDLLFEEAAVNDATNGRSSQEPIRGMEGIVRHARTANPATDIVIMYFVDPDKMESYRQGQIPEVIENHEKVAEHYNIPTINLALEVTERIDAGEFNWEDDFRDLHPSPFGQGVYASSIIAFLDRAWSNSVDTENNIIPYTLPKMLDPLSYDKGWMIPVSPSLDSNGWQYNDNWEPTDGAGTRPNYTEVPMLVGQSPGEILAIPFAGTAIGLAVAAGPDAGIIEYRIDHEKWQQQDLFTKWSRGLHLPWYYTLDVGLDTGSHTLEVRLLPAHHPDSKGTVCRIRYYYGNK